MDDPTRSPGSALDPETTSRAPLRTARLPRARDVSMAVTLVMAMVLTSGIGLFVWLQISIPRLDRVGFPERALSHMVGRTLDVEEAIARAPSWEQMLYAITTDNGSNGLPEAIAWYRELAAVTYNPKIQLELGILEAEAGRMTELRQRLSNWAGREAPFPVFADIVRVAYGQATPDPAIIPPLQAELAEALPAGWFYDKAAMRLAQRAGDRKLMAAIRGEFTERVAPFLQKVRVMTAVELAVILVAGFAVINLVRYRRWPYTIGMAAIPPAWSGRAGTVVLIRGGAMGILVSLALLSFNTEHWALRLGSIPLASLPLLILTRQYLLAPHGVGFIRSFGLAPVPHTRWRLVTAVGAVVGIGLIGEWGLGLTAEWWGVSSHWTEWFDADLVWGEGPEFLVTLLEFTVLAPVFEELAFRGLLFGTLRRKFTWGASAVTSAALFAIAHGYGELGFVSVFWSGLLWAWIYEKTGSLWPSMIAHAANNLLVCLSLMYLFRPIGPL